MNNDIIVNIEKILSHHDEFCILWHQDATIDRYKRIEIEPTQVKILEEHKANFNLWHQEDIARRMDVPERIIVEAKRAIDKLNQLRNDLIEEIDLVLIKEFEKKGIAFNSLNVPQNSETIGSIIDRLSILSLKIYHMDEQSRRKDAGHDHQIKCLGKLGILKNQRDDLTLCLEQLIAECLTGKKKIKIYRQFKMYNDPSLNPELYTRQERRGSK
ncbi:MAG: DUF4254 domain-containing protein [Bacteroidetes bacterium]|nr:DUF4254 domain-containing protein [Bacteroidota bacterium]